jgi:L-iditol 2-dehydrogenase
MGKSNTALTIPHPGEVALVERPYPRIQVGYALVQVEIAPICIEHQVYKEHRMEWHSDADHQGHEGVGTIIEVAEGSRFEVGDRVILYQGNPCGSCFVCERGLSPTHCLAIPYEQISGGASPHAALEALGGGAAIATPGGMMSIQESCGSESGAFGFERFRIAPERMIQKIPDTLDFRYAAAANCSAGCTYTGAEESGVKPGDWVMVAGIGFIGFGAIINAKYRGAKVIALGRNPERMAIAKTLGADHIIDPEAHDWLEQVHRLTGRLRGVDHVFEASGHPFYQERALKAVRRYGSMYMFGFVVDDPTPFPLHLLDQLHNRHVSLTGGHDVRVVDREGLVDMLCDPLVQKRVDRMVTHHYNMSDAARGFEAALTKKTGKIYLYPQENCPA